MEKETVFFTLTGFEASEVGAFSVGLLEGMMEKRPNTRLEGKLLDGFQRLQQKVMAIDENNLQDIPLDPFEAFALQHALTQISFAIEFDTKPFESDDESFLQYLEYYKELVPDLLWRLIPKLGYEELSVAALEVCYKRETGVVRSVDAEETEDFATFTINEHHEMAFPFIFQTLDLLDLCYEEYDFARRFHEHLYIHHNDYKRIKQKMQEVKAGDKVPISMRDSVVVYWLFALLERLFISDAADYLDELGEKSVGKELYIQSRGLFLRFAAVMVTEMKASIEKFPEISYYLKQVDRWVI
jgi:hypothetical protein